MTPSNHVPKKQETPIHEYQLFVAGESLVSQRAIKNSQTLLEKYLKNNFRLELTDIYKQPEKAVEANIITTPALIRKAPLPELTIIGDLSDLEKVAKELLLY
jgi:circadian clock protein KaiB